MHYEKQEEGFSIDLNIDFSKSTQFAQPFSVVSVDQDGFTSGRLDGLEIDASGTIRANYTNGQNNPLGKIVVANFNNQNGLKQIGNATTWRQPFPRRKSARCLKVSQYSFGFA